MKKRSVRFKKTYSLIFVIVVFLLFIFFFLTTTYNNEAIQSPSYWKFQSIDTMKYSRDLAREKLRDPSFTPIINQQIKEIADTGATHVAIDTPYDEEFVPILKRWVAIARKYHLNVWFRGNWSGWQEWFDYPKIGREEHIKKTEAFILKHPELFEDGDVFSACPECENGGPGDPRMTGDVEGHRQFLIDEYTISKKAFQKIHKDVATNYNSMNGDVAWLIMDPETTKALGGLVVIDHYVSTPEQLVKDIRDLAVRSGGKVVLGEFGAPIPDIHGDMTDDEQAAWISKALGLLIQTEDFVGMNYWTNVGSSTELWDEEGTPRKAVKEIKKIYTPTYIKITVKNEAGQTIKNATLTVGEQTIHSEAGKFVTIHLNDTFQATIAAKDYVSQTREISQNDTTIILKKQQEDLIFKFKKWLFNLFSSD